MAAVQAGQDQAALRFRFVCANTPTGMHLPNILRRHLQSVFVGSSECVGPATQMERRAGGVKSVTNVRRLT